MNSRGTIRPYNAHVLVGNWYEDRVMEEVGQWFYCIRSYP